MKEYKLFKLYYLFERKIFCYLVYVFTILDIQCLRLKTNQKLVGVLLKT